MSERKVLKWENNGFSFDSTGGWAESATNYARERGFNFVVVVATEISTGAKEYVIFDLDDNQPIFNNQSFEAIAVHVDMLKASRDIKD